MKKRNDLDGFEDFQGFGFGLDDDSSLDVEEIPLRHYRFSMRGMIEEEPKYDRLVMALLKAGPNDMIDFIINCQGGCMYLMNTIIQSFKLSGIRTRAIVTGMCYSAASMIALSCDEIIFCPGADMMIHCAQLGHPMGPARAVESKVRFDRKNTELFIDEVYGDFLTPDELEDVKEYKEVWLDHKDVQRRLVKWRKAKKVNNTKVDK